ncbi:MAG: hypothetical protein GX959_05205 [Clostridiales bacterium]|jgi:hypothetical protein|nr:hypothetical protein [Clostridiales bacterium]
MVTLRRDVAAMQKNDIFDYDRSYGEITEYDRFMQEKMKAENKSYYYSADYFTKPSETYAISEMIATGIKQEGLHEIASVGRPDFRKESMSADNIVDYDAYMMSQLNRKTPEKILSKEEFYQTKTRKYAVSKTKNNNKIRNKVSLSKRAKIFIVTYMLAIKIVGILFFFLI